MAERTTFLRVRALMMRRALLVAARASHPLAPHAPPPVWRLLCAATVAGQAATTTVLRNVITGQEVYLVGTAHVSKRSADEVKDVIARIQPDTVFLELCETRAEALMRPRAERPSAFSEMLSLLSLPGSVTTKLLSLSMRGFYAAWRHAGLEPGAEFRVAIEEAKKLGATLVNGDRDATETIRRLAATIRFVDLVTLASPPPPPPELAKIMTSSVGVEEAIERLKSRENIRAMVKYSRSLHPEAVKVMLDERDDILAERLRACKGAKVVGVVGAAHLDGIEKRWEEMNAAATR